ncbi:MAG: radical SAM family heme chaperone HemW [Bacteroidota bacterium]|nr:radical SAM family heme chaperone HemW [Bacteroidota bacterium]
MGGIYIHVPFCKQQCHYCDFHFSTSLKNKNALLVALVSEIRLRKSFFDNTKIHTIYLGGGTPSLLSADEVNKLYYHLNANFDLSEVVEMTIEANPDDLTEKKIKSYKNTPINRFSIGVQSFHNKDLRYMNRAHDASQAESCIKAIQNAGWDNISIDLIYGLPTLPNDKWLENLVQVVELGIPHLSAYALTVEDKTPLHYAIKTGQQAPLDEKRCNQQFQTLMNFLPNRGWKQYELSNFSKPRFESKHNSSYWQQKTYLGLGPSAHSFDGKSRMWNIANNVKYIQSINKDQLNFKQEYLSETDHYNEYVLTSLRTHGGADFNYLKTHFSSFFCDLFLKNIEKWIKNNKIEQKNNYYILTEEGKLLADLVTSDVFFVS